MILLDTHVALWLVAAPDRIGARSRHAMERSEVCYFSAISLAECAIKRMIGRLDVPADLARVLTESGLRAPALLPEHADAIEKFPELARHDPFDRLLLGQALVERCRFLTADRRLLALHKAWIIPADE